MRLWGSLENFTSTFGVTRAHGFSIHQNAASEQQDGDPSTEALAVDSLPESERYSAQCDHAC